MKTTVKFRLRVSHVSGYGKIVLCITRRRITRSITIPYSLSIEEWDEKSQQVLTPKDVSQKREKQLNSISRKLQKLQKGIRNAISIWEGQGDFKASDVIDYFCKKQHGILFNSYVSNIVESLKTSDKYSTAHAYECAARSFLRFLKGNDIRMEKITSHLMEDYQQFLFDSECMKNTVSCYMRSLRATYNLAIREKFLEEKKENPFSNVFTGNAPTAKRAISKDAIGRIMQSLGGGLTSGGLTPPRQQSIQFSRDLFLFSFYTQGMSFVDMINLKKENIKSGKIQYHRKKTGQLITIELEDCMKEIINCYADEKSCYIFPVLREIRRNNKELSEVNRSYTELEGVKENVSLEHWKKTRSALATYNRHLKKLATLENIEENLTSYVSRHSWATMAAQEGIPVSTISRGMGHESEKTTRIYIGRLDYSDVKEANRRILAQFVDKIPENHTASQKKNSM